MTYTPILHLPQVAPNQNQKEATINTALAILEAASNDVLVVSVASGDHVLTQDQFTKYALFRVTGAGVARSLWTPDTPRFFAVSNEGSATVTVRPNGSAAGSVAIPAGKIVFCSTDGDTVRALSSGVGLLTDLGDVDLTGSAGVNAGDVLTYDGAAWVPGPSASATFLGLTDTPSNYTSDGDKFVRVNSGETALTFVDLVTSMVTDFPDYNVGNATNILTVTEDGNSLEWVSFSVTGVQQMGDLTDVELGTGLGDGDILVYRAGLWEPEQKPNSITHLGNLVDVELGTGLVDGYVLKFRDGIWQSEPDELGKLTFLTLNDTPDAYTGQGGKVVRVNAGGTALEFGFQPTALADLSDVETGSGLIDGDVLTWKDGIWQSEPPPGIGSLVLDDLSDVDTTGAAEGDVLALNGSGDWVPVTPAGEAGLSLKELNDAAVSYAGRRGSMVQISPLYTDPDDVTYSPVKVQNLYETPDYGAHEYWRLNVIDTDGAHWFGMSEIHFRETPNGLNLVSTVGGSAVSSSAGFSGNTPALAFDGDDETYFIHTEDFFPDPWEEGYIGFHFDDPVSVTEVAFNSVVGDGGVACGKTIEVQYSDDGSSWTTAWTIADAAEAYGIDMASFNPPEMESAHFLSLYDTPNDYTGQAGKIVRVNSGETGVEFADPSFVEVDTTKTASFTLDADDDAWIPCAHGSTPIVATIPANATWAAPIGTVRTFNQSGVAGVSLAAAGGVTLQYASDMTLNLRTQGSVVSITKVGSDTWVVYGDLEAV